MQDQDKTKEQLIEELKDMRLKMAEFEATQSKLLNSEKALKESEERFRQFYEDAPLGYQSLDENGYFLDVNPAWLDTLGYSREEVLGKWFGDFLAPGYQEHFKVNFPRFKAAGEIHGVEFEMVKKDGSRITVAFDGKIGHDQVENFKQTHCILHNITERKQAEEALRESEQRYRGLVEHLPQRIFIKDRNSVYLSCNGNYASDLGITPEEIVGKDDFAFHPPELAQAYRSDDQACMDTGMASVTEKLYQLAGEDRWAHTIKVPYHDRQGLVIGVLGIFEDITERKRVEEQLQRSEEKYLNLFQDAPLMYVITRNEQGVPFISDCNKLFLRSVGFAREEVIGKPLADFYSPESRARLLEGGGYTRALAGEFIMGERQLVTHDGELIQTFLYTKPETDHSGHVTGTRAMFVDITAARKSEETQRRLSTAIEQSIEAVMITDRNGKIQYINPAFEHISGYRKEEVIGRDTRFLKNEELDSSYYKEPLAAIRSGKPWKGRLVSQRKDGQIFYEDVAISPVRDSSGEIVSFVDVAHDVTENVELQIQLIQAQKMEAVGTLAGGIAHDFNNLLQVVLGYSELILQHKKAEDPDYADLQKICQAGKRGADLVKSLLTFSRKVETKYVPVDLNQEITSIRSLLSRTIPKTIRIDLHLSGALESIHGDSSQIGQVLMNLGVNARDAMPDGGILTIETENIQLDEEYCSAHLDAKPGSYVLLTVSDTGKGMDKKTLSHIFEPFFTTKETGKGTGLGLATVYGIVKQHDGHIMCYSELGAWDQIQNLPACNSEGARFASSNL
ncbi:MAG: PAS domain S-box protein [Desulfomonilaceae bacterium]